MFIEFLKLQDVTFGYSLPCIMDVKIGQQTFDPNAPQKKREREVAKYKYQHDIGFRICGMKVLYFICPCGYVCCALRRHQHYRRYIWAHFPGHDFWKVSKLQNLENNEGPGSSFPRSQSKIHRMLSFRKVAGTNFLNLGRTRVPSSAIRFTKIDRAVSARVPKEVVVCVFCGSLVPPVTPNHL